MSVVTRTNRRWLRADVDMTRIQSDFSPGKIVTFRDWLCHDFPPRALHAFRGPEHPHAYIRDPTVYWEGRREDARDHPRRRRPVRTMFGVDGRETAELCCGETNLFVQSRLVQSGPSRASASPSHGSPAAPSPYRPSSPPVRHRERARQRLHVVPPFRGDVQRVPGLQHAVHVRRLPKHGKRRVDRVRVPSRIHRARVALLRLPPRIHRRRVRRRVQPNVLAPEHLCQQVMARVRVQRTHRPRGTQPRVRSRPRPGVPVPVPVPVLPVPVLPVPSRNQRAVIRRQHVPSQGWNLIEEFVLREVPGSNPVRGVCGVASRVFPPVSRARPETSRAASAPDATPRAGSVPRSPPAPIADPPRDAGTRDLTRAVARASVRPSGERRRRPRRHRVAIETLE